MFAVAVKTLSSPATSSAYVNVGDTLLPMAAVFSDLNDPNLVAFLQRGAIGVLPTDTLYGLVCIASQKSSVERLYSLKNRTKKSGTIIAADINQLVDLGLKRRYLKAVEEYWPGPVSIVIPFTDPSAKHLHHETGGLAVRVVKPKKLQVLLEQTGALLTSSANPSGGQPAQTIEQAGQYFGDSVDFYVDGGDLSERKPSTVIRIVDDAVEVLREGVVEVKDSE